MNGFNSFISFANMSNDICCAPSLQASAGLGCTSINNASAPMATAPLHIAATRSARPAPWLGSTTIGQCDSRLMMGMADQAGVALRGGHHCTQPLMRRLGVESTARASFYFYNTKAEVDRFVEVIREIQKFFGG